MPATHIAFCITELDPGGAERAFVRIVRGLDRDRWEPHVYCLAARGPLAAEFESVGIPVTCLGAKSPRDIGVIWSLRKELQRHPPALLQTFLIHANIAGCLAGQLAGVPHIVTGVRVADGRKGWKLRLEAITSRFAEMHVCVSRGVADFSIGQGGLTASKVVVIPNGVDFERFATGPVADLTPLGIPAGSPVVITVGRLDPQKGMETLLKAWPEVAHAQPTAHLLVVGDGPQRQELESLAQQSTGGERIHFSGYRHDIPGLLRAASVLALPSLWEGMPNVVLEAMAAALPVVSSDVEGTDELIQDGVAGLVVPRGNPGRLSAALIQMLSETHFAKACGKAGQHRVQSEFTWDRVVAAYVQLYEEILGNQSERAKSTR